MEIIKCFMYQNINNTILDIKIHRSNDVIASVIMTGIYIILFLPLFVNQRFLFPFVFPKTILFRVIVEILLFLYLILCLRSKTFYPKVSPIIISLSIFIFIMAISSILGVDWHRSFWSSIERSEGILTWLHFLALFVILAGILKTKEGWIKIFWFIILSGWLQAIYALLQTFGIPGVLKTTGQRIEGSIGNPSFLATYVLFIIFIAVFIFIQKNGIKEKIFSLLLICINIVILWQTQTRGAVLAGMAGVLIVMLVAIFILKNKWKYAILMALIFSIALGIYIYNNKDQSWIQNQPTLKRLTKISWEDTSTQNRLLVWKSGWRAFEDRPVLGWGWENFGSAFNKHFNPAIAKDIGSLPWYDRAHNVIVEIGVNLGMIGLISYMGIFFSSLYLLLRKKTKISIYEKTILTTALIVYFLQNLFVFDTLSSYILFIIIIAYIHFLSHENTADVKKSEKLPQFSNLLIVILAAFLTGTAVYFFNMRPVYANLYTVQAITQYKTDAEKMKGSFEKAFLYSPPQDQELRFILVQYTRERLAFDGINEKTTILLEFTIKEMRSSIDASPYNIQNYLLLAELYLAASDANKQYISYAEDLMQQAQKYAPQRYQIYSMLGRIKMSEAKFDQGIKYFQTAAQLNKEFAEGFWNLAIAHILSGDTTHAKENLDKAFQLGYDIYSEDSVDKLYNAYKDSRNLKAMVEFLEDMSKRYPNNKKYIDAYTMYKKLYDDLIQYKENLTK